MNATSTPPTLVVAGLSARLMAEAAARDGYAVTALDVFGDVDTRRAAACWRPIARPGAVQVDAERLLAALAEAASSRPRPIGWVAVGDLEGDAGLLARGDAVLPLIGTAPDAVRRVRDPAGFFAALHALGLPHPETRLDPPAEPRGWLCKHARSAGGWHIRRAGDPRAVEPGRLPYYQREQAGRPMSVLFVANGREARRLGFHELIVRPLGAHPHVYRGAIGPLPLAAPRLAALDAALQALTAHFSLRGLASLDFLDDGPQWHLLEINPRPSASMGLHDGALMHAHVEASLHGRLPPVSTGDAASGPPGREINAAHRAIGPARHATGAADAVAHGLRGSEIVFAPTALQLTEAQAASLAVRGDCHDLPHAGSRFEPGDPVCSVSAQGRHAAAVREALSAKRRSLRTALAAGAPIPASEA